MIDYCLAVELTESDGEDCFLYWRGEGFPKGDWRAVIDRRKKKGWMESQQEEAEHQSQMDELYRM